MIYYVGIWKLVFKRVFFSSPSIYFVNKCQIVHTKENSTEIGKLLTTTGWNFIEWCVKRIKSNRITISTEFRTMNHLFCWLSIALYFPFSATAPSDHIFGRVLLHKMTNWLCSAECWICRKECRKILCHAMNSIIKCDGAKIHHIVCHSHWFKSSSTW